MWTVRCGSHVPMLTSGAGGDVTRVVVFDDDGSAGREFGGQAPSSVDAVVVTPVGLCARGCRKTATGSLTERLDELGDDRPLVVEVDTDDVGAELVEQVEQRRERRVLDDHSITESHNDLGHAVEGIHRSIDHGQRLGRERPACVQPCLESGQHRVVEVAGRQRLPADLGDDRPEIGQQRRRWACRSTGRERNDPDPR